MTHPQPDQGEQIDDFLAHLVFSSAEIRYWKDGKDITAKAALLRLLQDREKAVYDRGYNTGFVKARRSHDVRKLEIAAKQLEALAKDMRSAMKTAQQEK